MLLVMLLFSNTFPTFSFEVFGYQFTTGLSDGFGTDTVLVTQRKRCRSLHTIVSPRWQTTGTGALDFTILLPCRITETPWCFRKGNGIDLWVTCVSTKASGLRRGQSFSMPWRVKMEQKSSSFPLQIECKRAPFQKYCHKLFCVRAGTPCPLRVALRHSEVILSELPHI